MTNDTLIAGIDLGGTKLAVTIANTQGIVHKLQAPVITTGERSTLAAQAWRMIDEACTAGGVSRTQVKAVGISTCSPFVRVTGLKGSQGQVYREVAAPNLCGGLSGNPYGLANDWTQFPLESYFTDKVDTVAMENDGVAILAAERLFGAARASAHCAYATWSTGIGFGLCVDGRLLAGKQGNAGHAGHSYVSDNDQSACGCGNQGDLESQISGKALARQWQESCGHAQATTQNLFDAAVSGDAKAMAIIDLAAKRMGLALYNLVVTLDLDLIAIGGSVFNHHQALLMPKLQHELHRSGMSSMTRGVSLVATALGENAGDLGALSLVMPTDWVKSFAWG